MANSTDSIVVDLTPQNVQVDMWQSPDYVIGLKSYVYNLQFQAAGMGPPGPAGAPGKDSTVPGPVGPPGASGLPGPPGLAATCNAGSTATLSPGSAATVQNVGSPSAAVFNFGIPSGLTGATGATGAVGAQGNPGPPLNPKGNKPSYGNLPPSGNQPGDLWMTVDTGHGWSWNGTSWIDLGQWQGIQGIQGVQGNPGAVGPAGSAATVAVGTTSTLVPGSNATVSNSGSSSAAVFNFGIPAGIAGNTGATGATGPAGSAGAPGAAGAAGANSWTLSSASFTVPAVGSTAVMSVSDTSWAVVGEYVWVATAGGSANAPMALQITAKTGTSLTLLNPPTAGTQVSGDANNLLQIGSDSLIYLSKTQALQAIPPGIIWDYAGSTLPAGGWLWCDGTSYPTASYPNLYNAIGYTYGGSGANFNVPDRRGRVAIGVGQGTGLTNRVLAATGGEENHQLVIAELASHTHIQNSHTHTLGNSQGTASGGGFQLGGNTAGNSGMTSTTAVNQNTGSDTAHNNMQPFLVQNYIIKT